MKLEKIKELKGYDVIEIKNYTSSTGSVSDVVLDVKTTYTSAKQQDLETLQDFKDIEEVDSIKDKIDLKDQKEYEDLWVKSYDGLQKSLSKPIDTTKPTNTYKPLNKGVKTNAEEDSLYVTGFIISRVEITPPTVETKPKKKQKATYFKEYFKKSFLTETFKNYKLKDFDMELDKGVLRITIK